MQISDRVYLACIRPQIQVPKQQKATQQRVYVCDIHPHNTNRHTDFAKSKSLPVKAHSTEFQYNDRHLNFKEFLKCNFNLKLRK